MNKDNSYSSLKDIAYNSILEDILSHDYLTGDVLNEKKLVEKYGYSKTPIREALLSLCNDGVLRNIPRYGYEIIRVTKEDVKDMLQFRYILETGVLKLNLSKFTEIQIKKLSDINSNCSKSENGLWDHWDLNTDFHVKMLSFSHNTYAVNELRRCMDKLKRAYAQLYWYNLEVSTFTSDTRHHKNILSALENKDLPALLLSLKHDIEDFGGLNAFDLDI